MKTPVLSVRLRSNAWSLLEREIERRAVDASARHVTSEIIHELIERGLAVPATNSSTRSNRLAALASHAAQE